MTDSLVSEKYHVGTPPKEMQWSVAEAPAGTLWMAGHMRIFKGKAVVI